MPECYQPRVVLEDSHWFHGRMNEIRQLFSYLNKHNPNNVSLVGQRRIGKSWLLKVVELDAKLRAEYLKNNVSNFTFIYWDLQAEHRLAPDPFFERLIELLIDHLPPDLARECRATRNPDELEDSLDAMLDLLEVDEHRVVLLMDEFGAIMRNKEFAEGFFSHLRSLFSRSALTCVTASYRTLQEISHLSDDSPFFNIFSKIQLKLMTDQEARTFIEKPFSADGVRFEPQAIAEMLRITGPHPCFISHLCHDLSAEVAPGTMVTKANIEQYRDRLLWSMADDFAYYWQKLDDNERAMLQHIGAGDQVDPGPILQRLDGLSLIRREGGRVVPFSESFAQFIAEAKGSDIYFERAFSNPELEGPNFVRLCEIVLKSATHLPRPLRADLAEAVRLLQDRPKDAMRVCGRDVLDTLLELSYRTETQTQWNGEQYPACEALKIRAEQGAFPKHLAAHFTSVRISGRDGAHPYLFKESCTPARAFLTVLETIHLAEEVYKRYYPRADA